jgi:hypothetical protein
MPEIKAIQSPDPLGCTGCLYVDIDCDPNTVNECVKLDIIYVEETLIEDNEQDCELD